MSVELLLARLRQWGVLPKSLDRLREDIAELRQEISRFRSDVESVKKDLVHQASTQRNGAQDLAAVRQELSDAKAASRTHILTRILYDRLASYRANWQTMPPPVPAAGTAIVPEPFEAYLQRFKAVYPHLYETWAAINFDTNLEEYRKHPESSCSVGTHECAFLFAGFAAPYLHGRVLDLGCGPYRLPVYLQGYPLNLIAGIDPLPPFEEHPFEFVQGFAEFLPWRQAEFDVVLAATSLDHVLSLDMTLLEIKRVLRSGGFFLVWEGCIQGSKRYNPFEKHLVPVDTFHLFHFDEKWFEEIMAADFSMQEKLNVDGSNVFYAFKSCAATDAPVRPVLHG